VKGGLSRTTWAALIATAAIGVPSAAWFVAGSRAAEQQAERIAGAPQRQAQQEAERIARRLAVRLESLRHSETRRAYLDYAPHLHDYSGECECEPPLQSPLAHGPADPLIWTHFQIDEVGQLTLPSLAGDSADDPARTSARRALSDEHAILEVLECAGGSPLTELPTSPSDRAGERIQGTESDWVVTVGPFQWHEVTLEAHPALVALRQVSTAGATLTQGFVIRRAALEGLLSDALYPARLRPGSPVKAGESRIPFDGEPWTVALDASAALAGAAARAEVVPARFRMSFAAGLLAAMLGAGLIVGLVWQTERLAKQRARFAASAAHELRTPLAGLRMYGEMLADETGDPHRKREYALRIAGEAERLGRVVSNLLGFSKLERGELKLDTAPGDLAAAVRDSVQRLRPALEAEGARVETAISESLPAVRFDRDAVHQILQNLLDNAARFNRAADDRSIRVLLDDAPDGPCLSVIDHGPGVAPTLRDKLFQAFVRDPSPDAPDGLGLGLTLVQALVQAQDATVVHADVDGGGSRFTVTFPRPA
jgi:signal transduction histidine kinase